MSPSLRLVTWFGSLLCLRRLKHITCSWFHGLKAFTSPYAQRNAFPIYVKAIHTALPWSFESVFWVQQHSISSVRAICSAIMLSAGMQLYCSTVLILEGAGKLINWKAIGFQLKIYFFLAHCALQGNLCGSLLKRKSKMQLCSELGQMQYYSKSRVIFCSVSYLFLLTVCSLRSWARLILCLHQLPTTPAAQFHISLTAGSLHIYCSHTDTSKANAGSFCKAGDEHMLDRRKTSCRGAEGEPR